MTVEEWPQRYVTIVSKDEIDNDYDNNMNGYPETEVPRPAPPPTKQEIEVDAVVQDMSHIPFKEVVDSLYNHLYVTPAEMQAQIQERRERVAQEAKLSELVVPEDLPQEAVLPVQTPPRPVDWTMEDVVPREDSAPVRPSCDPTHSDGDDEVSLGGSPMPEEQVEAPRDEEMLVDQDGDPRVKSSTKSQDGQPSSQPLQPNPAPHSPPREPRAISGWDGGSSEPARGARNRLRSRDRHSRPERLYRVPKHRDFHGTRGRRRRSKSPAEHHGSPGVCSERRNDTEGVTSRAQSPRQGRPLTSPRHYPRPSRQSYRSQSPRSGRSGKGTQLKPSRPRLEERISPRRTPSPAREPYTPRPTTPRPTDSQPRDNRSLVQRLRVPGELALRLSSAGPQIPGVGTSYQLGNSPASVRVGDALWAIRHAFDGAMAPFLSAAPNIFQGQPMPRLKFELRGVQVLIPPRTELRVQAWMLMNPSWTPADWLPRCLEKGLPFRVLVHDDVMTRYRPDGLVAFQTRPAWLSQRKAPLDDRSGEAALLCCRYLAAVTNVLQCPHTRRYLAEGGILWRLAIQYGQWDLYSSAFTGPSSTATVYGRASMGAWRDDLLEDHETAMLLGVTFHSGFFWPQPTVINEGVYATGEWTEENETWFTNRATQIAQGIARPKGMQGWQSQFWRSTGNIDSTSHAAAALAEIQAGFSDIVPSRAVTLVS